MSLLIAEHELFQACRVLFGADLQITREFLEYLQPAGIKSAYRKRALETHPDTAAIRSELHLRQSADLFRKVREAYEHLNRYLDARDNGGVVFTGRSQPPPAARRRPWNQKNGRQHSTGAAGASRARSTAGRDSQTGPERTAWSPDNLYQGILPPRPLRLGHFLYYSGLITWRDIIRALVWQRTQRPRLGEIGRRYGWLSDHDIMAILQDRQLFEPFGQSALKRGLLTEQQLNTLIFRQKILQPKFGEYFIESNLLDSVQLAELLRLYHMHNRQFGQIHRGSRFRP